MVEVTLLGQNVNSYGVGFGDRLAFGKLLRACGGIDGLERVRFTSPHPRDFTDDVIAAMAQTPNVMPQLHMPLQSGSDAVLRAMRRAYRRDKYLGILDRVRAAIPDAAITTDIIVGFPGETEQDFAGHPGPGPAGQVRRRVHVPVLAPAWHPGRADGAPGPGRDRGRAIPAAHRRGRGDHPGREPAFTGRQVEVLVAEGEGRKDGATHRMSGRARDNRLVHFAPGGTGPRPGDLVTTVVTRAAPHYLVADGPPLAVRRTRGGDAWQARQEGPAQPPQLSRSACPP